jgi:hypothetical protein
MSNKPRVKMQLKKHIKDTLSNLGHKDFINEMKDLSIFYKEFHIKKLTIKGPRPQTLIGQNCLILIQTNLYRSQKLAEGFIDGFNKQNPLASTLIVRAYFETTGALALLLKKYLQYSNGTISHDEFDDVLKSLYLGTKDKTNIPEAPDPFNVMKLIDAVDNFIKKKYKEREPKFRIGYDGLSEISHPNSFGYLLGHSISKDLKTIRFSGETEIFPLKEFHFIEFAFSSVIYRMIYKEIRELIENQEELPFNEFQKK